MGTTHSCKIKKCANYKIHEHYNFDNNILGGCSDFSHSPFAITISRMSSTPHQHPPPLPFPHLTASARCTSGYTLLIMARHAQSLDTYLLLYFTHVTMGLRVLQTLS